MAFACLLWLLLLGDRSALAIEKTGWTDCDKVQRERKTRGDEMRWCL